MSLSLEHILALDDFTREDREAIRVAMESDAQLRTAVKNWISVSEHIKHSIQTDFPSSEAIVLFALRNQTDWNKEELAEIQAAELAVTTAIQNFPSIERIVSRIQDDASVFDQCWSDSLGTSQNANKYVDRGAVAPKRNGLPVMRLVRWSVSVAAVIALTMVGITQFGPESDLDLNRIETASNELRTITLEDGSTARLSPSSSLTWSGEFNRSLNLEGSAFFDVVESPKTFTVQTESGLTTVLGTSFGMQTMPSGETVVTLVSGRVGITLPEGNLASGEILTPGMQGILSKSGISVTEVNLTEALAWSELIVFKDTPLEEVISVLSKRYEVKIELSDSLKKTPLTGTFEQDRGVQEILEIVAAALGASVEKSAGSGVYSLSR